MEVAGGHTYLVGSGITPTGPPTGWVWVHNACKISDLLKKHVDELDNDLESGLSEAQKTSVIADSAGELGRKTVANVRPAKINPKDINFMQSTIKNETGGYTVIGNAEAIKSGSLKATDIPLIRVWKDETGRIWTLDHRRLAAFRIAGSKEIPVQWVSSEIAIKQIWKMTTKSSGASVRLKLGDGTSIIIE
jgi:hypothetical protein